MNFFSALCWLVSLAQSAIKVMLVDGWLFFFSFLSLLPANLFILYLIESDIMLPGFNLIHITAFLCCSLVTGFLFFVILVWCLLSMAAVINS